MTNIIHIMLDLETWGTEPGCDIRSIGACVFNPLNGAVNPRDGEEHPSHFYIATDNPVGVWRDGDFHIGERHGKERLKYIDLTRDPKTVEWWNDPERAEATKAFDNPVDLRDALRAFGDWLHAVTQIARFEQYPITPVERFDGLRLWSHGPAFDPPILAAAYRAVGLPVPWHYRAPRDTLTAFDMAGVGDHSAFLDRFSVGTFHHALDDAICQARAVCAAYETVTEWADSDNELNYRHGGGNRTDYNAGPR